MSAAVPEPDGAQPKRMPPRHLRRTLYWLALDWIHLTVMFPAPPRSEGRTATVKEYGHPAEWASVKAAEIVDKMTAWHDFMAEERGETQPRRKLMRRNPNGCDVWAYAVNEKQRLVAAWKYLEPRCEQLVELVEAEALKELPDLHFGIRRALGVTAPKYTLPVPCPSSECGLRTLVRVQGVGQDFISCDACGYTIKEVHYPFLIRLTLDAVLAGVA
jgi:hypothetical protein